MLKIGFVGILIKLALGQYTRVVKQRDDALSKNLDMRFEGVKTHINHSVESLKIKVEAVDSQVKSMQKRIDMMKPSMDTSAKAIEDEVERYDKIIRGLKGALKKTDQKFSLNKVEMSKMQSTLSKVAEAIVTLNNRVAKGKIVKPVDANNIVNQARVVKQG